MSFRNCSVIKDESNKKFNSFCHVLNNIAFLVKGKLCKSKISFVMHPLQNPPLDSSTFRAKKINAVNKDNGRGALDSRQVYLDSSQAPKSYQLK